MPIASSCPEASLFERLRLGQFPAEEIEQFAQHVEQCPRCAAAVESLANDTLVEALKAKSTKVDRPEGEVVSKLAARLKQLRPVVESSEATAAFASVAPPVAPVEEGTQEIYDFLAPPRGPGEIGWLGPYRILKILGVGGMGVVFQAEDPGLIRMVALKAMKRAIAADSSARVRFLREAQTAAAVKNDHVVTIYQVGEDRGVPYLAMEFLEGEPLDGWLKRGRQPNLAQLLRMGREMALGLEAAHARGLIHRDIKPGNIWLEMPKGRIKLLDFGLARGGGSDVQVTQSGAIVGTPAYMAPEQARGEKVDPRADLFSLGCVLYRLATGVMPFKGTDTMSVLMSLAMDTPRPPREINPQLPPALGELIEKLLSKDPAGRPASAKAVVQALQNIEREAKTVANASHAPVAVAVSSASASSERTISSASIPQPQPTKHRRRLWGAVAVGLCALLGVVAATIILRIKTPDGKTTEMRVPEGTTVEVGHEKDVAQQEPPAVRIPPNEEAWLKKVAALSPRKQVEAVAARLKERNPGFDGKVELESIEDGKATEIRFLAANVTDLSPMRALVGLKTFSCPNSKVSDLSPLKGMPLASLGCWVTKVSDLSPLKGMPLKELSCAETPVNDLSPLEGMRLEKLDCNRSRVLDLSPLKDMKLTSLSCSNSKVADLSPLKGMPLTALECGGTKVSDLSPLKGMKLSYLEIKDTKVSDLSPLKGMPLTALECRGTKVSDLSPLKGMPLTSLSCWGTKVSDLSPLKDMKLTTLICPETQVSDLSPLKGMPLTSLSCWGTKVSDLSPLKGMPLTYLDCGGTKVSDLSPLKGMPLTSLSCWGTKVSDLSPLKGMPLTYLDCGGTKVSDLSPLKGMQLIVLKCAGSKVSDLTPLKSMPLKILTCDFKPERDKEILRSIKTLESINDKSAADFWKDVDAKETNKKP